MSTNAGRIGGPVDRTASVLFYVSLLVGMPYLLAIDVATGPRIGFLPTLQVLKVLGLTVSGLELALVAAAIFLARGTTVGRRIIACACIVGAKAVAYLVTPLHSTLMSGTSVDNPPTTGQEVPDAVVAGAIAAIGAGLKLSAWLVVRKRKWWCYLIVLGGVVLSSVITTVPSMYRTWSLMGLPPQVMSMLVAVLRLIQPPWNLGLLLLVAAVSRSSRAQAPQPHYPGPGGFNRPAWPVQPPAATGPVQPPTPGPAQPTAPDSAQPGPTSPRQPR